MGYPFTGYPLGPSLLCGAGWGTVYIYMPFFYKFPVAIATENYWGCPGVVWSCVNFLATSPQSHSKWNPSKCVNRQVLTGS